MGKIELNRDISLHYEHIEGNIEKPELVFLHEGLGCTAMWKDFPESLCQETGCPGLIYDRLGYGKSSSLRYPRDTDYLHGYALSELPAVLSLLIPERPYIIIGHSDGRRIGLIWAAQRPPLLLGLITEAAHVFIEPETLAGIKKAERAYEDGKLTILSKYHSAKADDVFKAWSDTWLSDWFKGWNIEDLLPQIRCPVLAVQGCDDQYGTQLQLDAITSQTSGAAKSLMVKKCGHTPHAEQTAVVLKSMADFINVIA